MGKQHTVGDWKRFRSEEKPSAFKVISRGWMNAQNRRSHYCKDTIEPGVIYDYQFSMVPMDHTVRRDGGSAWFCTEQMWRPPSGLSRSPS